MGLAENRRTCASGRRVASLAIVFLAIACRPSTCAAEIQSLGLCPAEQSRLDGFMRTICEGEGALTSGRHVEAIAKFRQAAQQQRVQATNEIAWAGLAAAYCKGRDVKRGREWAARFEEARRIWLGELDCSASTAADAPGPQPFVRDHMCIEPLAGDYSFVKNNPQASVSSEITARFADIAKSIEKQCSIAASNASADPLTKKSPAKKSAKKKPRKRINGKAASPARGR